ncbi:hypothetical protein [Psychromonas sp. Urea-02u-13]
MVEETLCLDPFSSQLFVLTNKRRNKIKISLEANASSLET